MLKGFNEKGELEDVKVKNGAICVTNEGGNAGGGEEVKIKNTEKEPVPVKGEVSISNSKTQAIPVEITNTKEVITTLLCEKKTINIEESTISVGKKVTKISLANFSDTSDVTITIGEKILVIAPIVTIDLPINSVVESFTIKASENNTEIQLVIEGVE